ncbi:unnamed protein product [Malus baccata var. baccata]
MTDSSSSPLSKSFVSEHWEGYKDFWCERFSFVTNYSKFVKRDKPLPPWSDSDVEAFIALDPVHGPALKTAREAVKFGLAGSVIGAVSTAGFAWRYSRSLHGNLLPLSFRCSLFTILYEQCTGIRCVWFLVFTLIIKLAIS